jgi:hypothetical protein
MQPRFARWFCPSIAVLGSAWLCVCIAPRVFSPWPLEWMEGASLEHALRLLHGQPLYAAPSGEFIAFVYPPLGYVPMALSAWLFGPTLMAARLVSVLALAVSLIAIARAAVHLAGRDAGFLAAGLYAFGYGYTGGFLDVVRVDGVFMALLLLGSERLCARRDSSALACFTLACFAKQHGVLFLIAAALFLLTRDGRAQRTRVIASFALLAVGCAALECWTQGWFSTYVLRVPQRHGLIPVLLLSFIGVDLGVYLPVLCVLAALSVLRHRAALRACDWLLLAGVVASALGRAHAGGDDNVRLPAYAMLVLVSSVGFVEWLGHSQRPIALSAALSLQALMLVQAPSLFAPNAASQAAFARLRAELQRCAAGGSSVALDYTRFTDTEFAHSMAFYDLFRNHDALASQAQAAIVHALDEDSAPQALALSAIGAPLRAAVEKHYALCATLPGARPPTGYAPGTTLIYRRIDTKPQPLL